MTRDAVAETHQHARLHDDAFLWAGLVSLLLRQRGDVAWRRRHLQPRRAVPALGCRTAYKTGMSVTKN